MIFAKRLRNLAATGLAALALSGCVSLLPKAPPAQLYRFDGATTAASAGAPATGRRVGVLASSSSFVQAASGDRLLSVTGTEVAYVAQSRWVAPASVLFDEAVRRAFDANAGPARLVTRGEVAEARLVMRLDVRNFETVYDQGPEAAPQVLVRVRAVITRASDRAVVGERILESKVRAGDNRVGAIVAAYDQAVGGVIGDLVGWTNGLAAGAAA